MTSDAKKINTNVYIYVPMGTQISIKLSDRMYTSAKLYAERHGFDSLQDMIRELIRLRVFEHEEEFFGGISTAMASESSLAKDWLSEEEEEAWKHLQKGR